CYYQAIDYALAHGLSRVEAGAQGEHKLVRGYMPCPTYSAHWIANPSFRDAIGDYLERETKQVDWEIEALGAHSPFRKGES
ncbi:MAG: GNAT family N-acetyltransferase, partial [Rhodospirillaceae bacterium]|nr:GNAT family N-acetyltransferase [Rhodospirillaceae bacterium]